jgi:hypothetical protein
MYKKLDSLIVAKIKDRKELLFANLMSGDVFIEAERIASATKRKPFRLIDARLQALRKRGLILCRGKTWSTD